MTQREIAMQSLLRWIEKTASNANTAQLDALELTSLSRNFNFLIGSKETVASEVTVPSTGFVLTDKVVDSILLTVPVSTVEAVQTIPSITKTTGLTGKVKIFIRFAPDDTTPVFTIGNALTLFSSIQTMLFGAPLIPSYSSFMVMDYLTSISSVAWSPIAKIEVDYDFSTGNHLIEFLGVSYPSVQVPIIPVPTVSEKTDTTAKIAGQWEYTGRRVVTEVGITLGQTGETDINVAATTVESPFTVDLADLVDDVVYAISTYVKFADGGGYSSDFGFFSAKDIPNVTTVAASEITATTATGGGSYVYNAADGIGAITEVGIEWKVDGGVYAAIAAGAVATPFNVAIPALTAASLYYVKAYVKVGGETFYGSEVNFNTLAE